MCIDMKKAYDSVPMRDALWTVLLKCAWCASNNVEHHHDGMEVGVMLG